MLRDVINQLLVHAPDMGLGTVMLIAVSIIGLGCGFLGYMLGTTVETAPLVEANRELEYENIELRDRVEHLEDTLSTMRAMEIEAARQAIATGNQHIADMAALGSVLAETSLELAAARQLAADTASVNINLAGTYNSVVTNLGGHLVAQALANHTDRQVMAMVIAVLSEELAHAKAEIAAMRSHRNFDYLTTVIVKRDGQEFMAHVPSFYSRHALDSASHVLMRVSRIFGLPNNSYLAGRMIKRILINGEDVSDGPCLAHIEPGDLVVVEFKDQ